MKISYSRRALAQIDEILATIEPDNPRAAESFARRVETLASLLARHPEVGRPTNLPEVRVMPVRPFPYLLFYATADGITLLRVRHMARKEDWRSGR